LALIDRIVAVEVRKILRGDHLILDHPPDKRIRKGIPQIKTIPVNTCMTMGDIRSTESRFKNILHPQIITQRKISRLFIRCPRKFGKFCPTRTKKCQSFFASLNDGDSGDQSIV
jgi:hypothetical protein